VVSASAALLALALPGVAAAEKDRSFDLQAHRGGMGLAVESSLLSFGNALDLGVSTLELDVQITADGHAVVTHDRRTNPAVCTDTAPAMPGDPAFPYVGRYVNTLTFAQVRTLDCGSRRKPDHPQQELSPGARMLELHEVFDLVEERGADDVRFNIETKVEAGAPTETAPREQFVQVVAAAVGRAGMTDRVSIQSFDWGALMRMREVAPELPIVALTNGDFLQVGQPGASPWLGGIDIDDFGGSFVAAAHSFGADAISPVHGSPQNGNVNQPGYTPFTTKEMVKDAHKLGMQVIPWTVDDVPTMESLIDAGVDGLITDYPDRLRELLEEQKLDLPQRYPAA
jgi:glycerophosphoryl diester phosphodiesterase